MPRAPKIKINELRKTGILKESRFYQLLSEQNNFMDEKLCKDFYMGLVRLLSQELRLNGVVRMPHLGHMALVKQKDRLGLMGTRRGMIIGKSVLKFYPKEAWRQYFSKIGSTIPGQGGDRKTDPRERVLGEAL